MTCIVALKHENTIYIGGDSAGSDGYSIQIRKDPKVWVNGEFVYGFTSSFRMGAILRYHFEPPQRVNMSVDKYMNTIYIDQLMQTLSDNWWIKDKDSMAAGGEFLVGYAGRIFQIQSDFQVAETKDNYLATGSGEYQALASLFTTDGLVDDPKKRITLALKSAEKFTTGVAGPFKIVKLEAK